MDALRKLVIFLAMLFLLFTVLVLLNVISVDYLDSTLTTFNPLNFFKTVFAISSIILLLVLVSDYLYVLSLKREKTNLLHQINELKAKLYDRKTAAPAETRNPGTPPPPAGLGTTSPSNNPPVQPS